MTTYTQNCASCGQTWAGWGNTCNDCQRLKLLKEANTAQAETAENNARNANRDADEARSARQEQRERDQYQARIDAFERSIAKQEQEEHNSVMQAAVERQANAAEEMLRISRKAEWARTHPIQPTKAKKIRKLANGKLIDKNTTLDEFNHLWDNTGAFWLLLNAYQIANGNDEELNLNDMYIEQGDIESAINLKRLLTEREILEAMEDGRWDDADRIRGSRDLTVSDKTTQQLRIDAARREQNRLATIAEKKAKELAEARATARIAQLTSDWNIAAAARVERHFLVLIIIYTVLFLMGCVYFAPWSLDWWPVKLFGLFMLYTGGMCITVLPLQSKPGTMPNFKN